jgi:alanyl-tRNA synthetase
VPTRKLFREDSHLCRFESRIVALRADGPWVALEATGFYPEEGGQRPDRGTIGGIPVEELAEDPEGIVWHRLARDPDWEVGRSVVGEIDAERRKDHRQQHSGQHILSRAFEELLGAPTRSFHMGEEVSTIDVDCADLDAGRLSRVEARANAVVTEDRPVLVSIEENGARAPGGVMEEPLRTVEVEGFDRQHCCGTHVRRTGEIGLIKALRWERAKGMVRVHFVCGDRALAQFAMALAAVDGGARLLSASWRDLPKAVEGLIADGKEAERRARRWQEEWAALEAERWVRTTPRDADGTLRIARWLVDAEAATLKAAANALLAHAPVVVVLGGTGEPGKRPFVAARSAELPAGLSFDSGVALAAVLKSLGGRGGGTSLFAQGSCPAEEEACRAALGALSGPLPPLGGCD